MRVTRKVFTREAANLFFLNNLVDFLNKIYTQKITLTVFFFVEKQGVLPFIVGREKHVSSSK